MMVVLSSVVHSAVDDRDVRSGPVFGLEVHLFGESLGLPCILMMDCGHAVMVVLKSFVSKDRYFHEQLFHKICVFVP